MDFNEYQDLAARTTHTDPTKRLPGSGLGIAGEAGEVADLIKKHWSHGHPLDLPKLIKELGDVLWYVSDIAHTIGVPLDVIATVNIRKLEERYPDGFSTERSLQRKSE